MAGDGSFSPVTVRPSHRPYRERYLNDEVDKLEGHDGPKLVRQMVIGFSCAALFGLIMLVIGGVFIGDAVKSGYAITIMLCVMGIVCGLIILVTAIILGKLFISRKWRISRGRPRRPPQQCMQTCSVIHTPSNDQLNTCTRPDPPPAYESIMMAEIGTEDGPIIMTAPPNYHDISAPLPKYGDSI
ncbi:uncharacterized protein LOC134725684 [Mytilus trossulus]|uniref:uncharacterized protein LOC134725684 n=1 Tax=Mytilus trossulus TaxID=6551 RepID=UPI003007ED79